MTRFEEIRRKRCLLAPRDATEFEGLAALEDWQWLIREVDGLRSLLTVLAEDARQWLERCEEMHKRNPAHVIRIVRSAVWGLARKMGDQAEARNHAAR